MPKEEWKKNPMHKVLARAKLWPFHKNEIRTVLDVGCGLSLKSKFLGAPHIVGVDIHEPYLKAIECSQPYSVVKYDVRKLGNIFLSKSFDVVYALEILEHLKKNDGFAFLAQCKRIAKKAVVVETPNGYVPQNRDIQGFGAHVWQTHRCGWTANELKALGFKCVVRPYKMLDVRRHTKIKPGTDIEVINAICCL